MADFDPYYVWLGIPPKNQPPDHYRLLGIEKFEPDPRVIESAADRQMAHVKTFQTGKNGADSQRVLTHLMQARNCLLNAPQKAEYDEALRRQLPIMPPGIPDPPMAIPLPPQAIPMPPHAMGYPQPQGSFPMAIPVPSGPEAPYALPTTLSAPPSPVATIRPVIHRQQKEGPSPLLIVAGLVGLVAVVGVLSVVLWNASTPKEVTKITKTPPTTTTDNNKAIPDTPIPIQSDESNTDETKTDETKATPPSDASSVPDNSTSKPNEPTTEASPPTIPAHFAALPTEPLVPAGPAVSVLKLVKGPLLQAGGASLGSYQLVNGELHGVNGGVLLPIQLPADYQLDFQIDYLANDAHLVFGFPVVGRPACVALNWHTDGTTVNGFHQLDGLESNRNDSTYKKRVFHSNKPSHMRCIVRGNFVQVVVDGEALIQWRGDPARLTVSPYWMYPGKRNLFVAAGGGDVRISSIEMTPLEPIPVAPRPEPLFVLAPARRFEAPSATELQQAKAAVRKLYSKEFAASKMPPAKRELAKTLFARAQEDKDGLALRVGLWTEAHTLAAGNLDAILACQAIDEQAKFFDIDALAMRTKGVEDAAKDVEGNTTNIELRNVTEATCVTLDQSIAAERFDLSKRLAAVLKRLSLHKRFGERREFATKRLAEVALANTLFDAAQAASGSDTPEAKNAIGRYQCFVLGNWSKGLPLLADGSDSQLAAIAKLELEVRADNATDEAKYRQLGDAWWLLAVSAEEPWNEEYRRQARYWYEQAPQQLSAQEFQERINDVPGIATNRYLPGLVAACYAGDQYGLLRLTRIDKNIARSWQTGSPDSSIGADHFTIVWTGTIQAPIPGKYYLSVNSDDGSRMVLDGKTLWDDLGGGSAVRGVEVDLTGAPQHIVLYYHEGIVHAHCTLRWRFTDETEDRIVDGRFLRHDPLVAKRFLATEVVGNYPETVHVPSVPEGGLFAIFEDQPELPAALPEDFGPMELETNDRYSGEASLRIGGKQRFGYDSMAIRARIRENPGPGEYRYARFAWKKVGGGSIALQFLGTSPTGQRDWRRYHTGPNKDEFPYWGGASTGVAEDAPAEWTVVTRDLFADHGEIDLTGLALTVFEKGYGLFDHIYLARTMHDFEKLGEPAKQEK